MICFSCHPKLDCHFLLISWENDLYYWAAKSWHEEQHCHDNETTNQIKRPGDFERTNERTDKRKIKKAHAKKQDDGQSGECAAKLEGK